jgi:hypothetical protein
VDTSTIGAVEQAIDFIAENGGTFAADDNQVHPENQLFQVGEFGSDGAIIGAAVVERVGPKSAELAAIATTQAGGTAH